MKTSTIATVLAAAVAAAVLVPGCTPSVGGVTTPAYQSYLYMTDTTNGHVYTYDPSTHMGSSLSLLTTSANAAGEIKFYKGIGYVAMGYGGIWRFDPSSANPVSKMVTGSLLLNAQYFAFYSAKKAYVSTVDYSSGSPTAGLYTFDPSDPTIPVSAVISGTSTKNFQEVIVGSDGKIYAANSTDDTVLRIDPTDDSVKATIHATVTGTTGLVAGTYNGNPGVFVANNGGYSGSSGAIDFIPNTGSTATTLTTAAIYPGRVAQLSNGKLIATGFGNTYIVDLAASPATVNEVKNGSASFGSLDIGYKDGLIYVPDYYSTMSNKLFIFDASGFQQSYSPVSVMTSSDGISNIGFYE